jgi:hypothetical protein
MLPLYLPNSLIGFAKPAAQKSQYKQRRLKDINMDAFKADIANSLLSRESRDSDTDTNKFTELYNSVLRQVLDKHSPEVCGSITLRPHAPWFTSELRELKREKRRCE